MDIEILYQPGAAMAKCTMQPGEPPLRAEAGSMIGMSPNTDMETSSGGLMKGLKSMFSGESFFTNKYTSTGGNAEVLVAASLPGDLAILQCDPAQGPAGEWHLQTGSFVCCEDTVEVETKSGGFKGLFSGAGLIKMRAHGTGRVVVGAFGALEPVDIDGEFIVDTGHLVAWQGTIDYKIEKAGGGFIAAMLSGEGLVCKMNGKGRVWIQTRNAQAFGEAIGPKMSAV
jgi:uncharacterized protein (TIGR00266 family)